MEYPGERHMLFLSLYKDEQKSAIIAFGNPGDKSVLSEMIALELGTTINRIMLNEEKKEYTRLLEQKVAERTAELRKAYQVLEKADEEKTRFFINLAHETKTPLTLIRNYLEKYVREHGPDSDLLIVRQNIDLLLRNMVNFLDLEKLLHHREYYDHEQTSPLTHILNDKIILFRQTADNRSITITPFIQENLYLIADPFAIDRIINNLLDNAIRYTQNGGTIRVEAKKTDGTIRLSVQDSGMGMGKEELAGLFTPFRQLSRDKKNMQGMGIGLSLVKMILDSLEAHITVESRTGKGSLFTMVFPQKRVAAGPGTSRLHDVSIPLLRADKVESVTDEFGKPDQPAILVIDDNLKMLAFLKSFLRERYNIFFAMSGGEALEKIGRIPRPDIIVSDVMMDDMDGFELLGHIRNTIGFLDIPFIFLTAKSMQHEKVRGLSMGAIDYIYKPFDIEELIARINAVIQSRNIHMRSVAARIQQHVQQSISQIVSPSDTRYVQDDLEEICRRKKLTLREREVLYNMKEGLLNKEIGSKLNITERTVEYHLHNIYQKFGVLNRTELIDSLRSSRSISLP